MNPLRLLFQTMLIFQGDMIVDENSELEISNQFKTKIIWMDEKN